MQPPDPFPRSIEQSGDDADVEITAPSGVEGQPSVPETEVEVLAAGTTAGRYMVLERVGSGGMGVVYAAFDHELDRKVALKVMHARPDGGQSTGSRERLLREAQAMAKLSHPNVITVHDVGTFDGRVFIAMEFIDGPTLRAWMAQGPHELTEIVDVFVKAGRGLAAAHAAGLVHRDFKPDNVLIGRDGRVLVMDFGLARQASAVRPTDAVPTPEVRGKGLHDVALTRTGALVGTPAYMAPEQHRGAAADPLVDQFGFCVALYEALYGQRPFAGNSVASIAINVLEGHVRSPPRGSMVPAWLRAVVVRGLAVAPEDRYPSMDALLAELQADPPDSRHPWRGGAIAIGMVAVLATTYLLARAFEGDPCEAEAQRLGQSWDAARRDAVRDAFSATGLPFADTSGQTTVRMLDAWTERWSTRRVELCQAVPPSSSVPLDAQPAIRCLDGQHYELDALVARLEHADPITVTQAVAAAAALPDPLHCETGESASDDDSPSNGPTASDPLRNAAARARVLLHTGAPLDAARLAEPLLKSAAAAEEPGLEAEAGLVLAQALDAQGEPTRAEEQLHATVVRAAVADRPALEAEAWLELVYVIGERLGLHDEAYLAAVAAEVAITRARMRKSRMPRLEAAQAAVALDQGRYEDAREHLEHARERLRSIAPMPELEVADAWQDFGTALDGLGRYDEALRAYEEALRLHEQLLGAQHPRVGGTLARLGGAMLGAGLLLQAEATFVRARWLLDPAHVTDEPLAADEPQASRLAEPSTSRLAELPRWQLCELAAVLDRQGLLERAREEPDAAEALHRRALALLEGSLDPRHRDLGYPLVNLGLSLTEQGRPRDALAYLQRAHEIWTAELDPQHPDLGLVSLDLANVLWALGEHVEARRRYADALAIWQAVLPEDHPLLAYALTGLGRCDLDLGARAAALESLERAYELRAEDEDRLNVAETSLLLARALWSSGTDPTRARALVVQARELTGAAEPVDEAGLQRVLGGQEYPRFTDQLEPAGLGATNHHDTRGGR